MENIFDSILEIFGKAGNTEALEGLFKELKTEVKELQKARDELGEKIKVQTDLVSYAVHELKSSICSARSSLELLHGNLCGHLNTQQKNCVEITVRAVERLIGIVNDLTDVELLRQGKLTLKKQTTNIAPLISDIITQLEPRAREKSIDIVNLIPRNLPPILVDPLRLEQIFINLISNGIKFTPREGTIIVGVTAEAEDKIRFFVKDDGIGIDPQYRQKIFEKYEQGPDQYNSLGMGLGLSIVKELIEAHGGQISIESEIGKGATFIFDLPLK